MHSSCLLLWRRLFECGAERSFLATFSSTTTHFAAVITRWTYRSCARYSQNVSSLVGRPARVTCSIGVVRWPADTMRLLARLGTSHYGYRQSISIGRVSDAKRPSHS